MIYRKADNAVKASGLRWMGIARFNEELVAVVNKVMGCFGSCFGYKTKTAKVNSKSGEYTYQTGGLSQEKLLKFQGDEETSSGRVSVVGSSARIAGSSDSKRWCDARVTITRHVNTSQDHEGNKMINQYVRKQKIGKGSYGKVVLHWNRLDHKFYAIKIFDKSRLRKIRVAPSETAMTDVLREVISLFIFSPILLWQVEVMKRLNHPNIVRLIEVIDDPECDQLYMVLEYLEGQKMFAGPGRPGGLDEATARRYFKDVVSGLIYLHSKNVIHGDIKPENLMITADGRIKIGDFGVSRTFEDDDDFIRRSPGTPVFTAPECCRGLTYRGRAADIWALGVTLYCMVVGQYPFVGESFQDTYDKIVQQELLLPPSLDPELRNLLERLLCKDPDQRITLPEVSCHPWVVRENDSV